MPLGKHIKGLRLSLEDEDLFKRMLEPQKSGYIEWRFRPYRVYLHSLIAMRMWGKCGKKDQSVVVDHIDRNRRNCERSNLRLIPQGGNLRNSSVFDLPSGVTFSEHRGKWRTRVSMNGETCYLGHYLHKEDALAVVSKFKASKEYQSYLASLFEINPNFSSTAANMGVD